MPNAATWASSWSSCGSRHAPCRWMRRVRAVRTWCRLDFTSTEWLHPLTTVARVSGSRKYFAIDRILVRYMEERVLVEGSLPPSSANTRGQHFGQGLVEGFQGFTPICKRNRSTCSPSLFFSNEPQNRSVKMNGCTVVSTRTSHIGTPTPPSIVL